MKNNEETPHAVHTGKVIEIGDIYLTLSKPAEDANGDVTTTLTNSNNNQPYKDEGFGFCCAGPRRCLFVTALNPKRTLALKRGNFDPSGAHCIHARFVKNNALPSLWTK